MLLHRMSTDNDCYEVRIMSVMLTMLKYKEELSMAERVVLDYLIENKESIKDFSVEKIAEAAYTSPASVVRMCKKLGYKGFKDFKIDFILANAKVEIPENKEYVDVILGRDEHCGRSAIVMEVTGCTEEVAEAYLTRYNSVKYAIFGIMSHIEDKNKIKDMLEEHNGNIRESLKSCKQV